MKTRRYFRTLLACLLAITVMLLPCLGAFAAKETSTVHVEANIADVTVTVEGIEVENQVGAVIDGRIEYTAEALVNGDIIAKGTIDKNILGINLQGKEKGAAKATVHGGMAVTGESTYAIVGGISDARDNAEAGLTVDGNVYVHSEKGGASGLLLNTWEEGNSAVHIGGKVTVEGYQFADGVRSIASNDSKVSLTVDGNILASAENGRAGAVAVQGRNSGNASVHLGGDVTAEGTNVNGVYVRSESVGNGKNPTATVTVDGTISAAGVFNTSGAANYGLYNLTIGDGAESVIQAGENVEGRTHGPGNVMGVYSSARDGKATITVKNDVLAEAKADPSIAPVAGMATGLELWTQADGQNTVSVEGDITAGSEDNEARGLHVITAVEGTTGITVGGDISGTVTGEKYRTATGILAETYVESETTITAGNVSATNKSEGSSRAIDVRSRGGDLTVDVTGDVTAKGTGYAVNVQEIYGGGDGKANIKVGGNVIADREGIHSLVIGPYTGDSTDPEVSAAITVGGDVTVEADTYGTGVSIQSNGGNTTTDIAGDVTVKTEGYSHGIQQDAIFGESVGTVGGDVSVTGISSDGLTVLAGEEGSTSNLTVGGDVTVTGLKPGEEDIMGSRARGITVQSRNDAEAAVMVNGDMNATSAGWTTGVEVDAYHGGTSNMTLNGDLKAVADGEATGEGDFIQAEALSIVNGEAKVNVTVNGDVSAKADTAAGMRIYGLAYEEADEGDDDDEVEGPNGKLGAGQENTGVQAGDEDGDEEADEESEEEISGSTDVTVNGNITAEGEDSIGIVVLSEDEDEQESGGLGAAADTSGEATIAAKKKHAVAKIVINGDVKAGKIGLLVNLDDDAPMQTDVIIDGTLSGGKHAIVLGDETTMDNVTITVWRIIPDEEGSVVCRMKEEDDEGSCEEDEAAEGEIQYIIRAVQPDEGGSFTLDGTTEYEGYDVANEGDLVYLKIEVEDGYDVVGAYNGTEELTSLDQDANGDYYLAVPRGGGVTLSLRLRKHQNDNPATDETPAVKVTTVRTVPYVQTTVTIDPNGGAVGEKTEAYTISTFAGKWLTLPEKPVKEGATFLGWYGTEYSREDARWTAPEAGSPELKKAFDQVQIDGDIWYTAIWAEAKD